MNSAPNISPQNAITMYTFAGLFHRAISQSGNALSVWAVTPKETSRYLVERLACLFDCPAQPSTEFISCLRKLDPYKLIAAELAISVRCT